MFHLEMYLLLVNSSYAVCLGKYSELAAPCCVVDELYSIFGSISVVGCDAI